MSREEFQTYWLTTHAELVKALPYVVRYVQNHVVDDSVTHMDGIVELWFESRADMLAAFASDIGKKLRADDDNFIGEIEMTGVDEHIIIP